MWDHNSQILKYKHYLGGKKNLVFYYTTQGELTFEECSSSNPCHSGYKLECCWSYLKQTNSAHQHQNHIHPVLVIVGIWYVFFASTVFSFSFMHHSFLIDLQMLDTAKNYKET